MFEIVIDIAPQYQHKKRNGHGAYEGQDHGRKFRHVTTDLEQSKCNSNQRGDQHRIEDARPVKLLGGSLIVEKIGIRSKGYRGLKHSEEKKSNNVSGLLMREKDRR